MWNEVDNSSYRISHQLADEFLKSELNEWIADDNDLKQRVTIFLRDKEEKLKHNYNKDLFSILRFQRQGEIRYSFDSY